MNNEVVPLTRSGLFATVYPTFSDVSICITFRERRACAHAYNRIDSWMEFTGLNGRSVAVRTSRDFTLSASSQGLRRGEKSQEQVVVKCCY